MRNSIKKIIKKGLTGEEVGRIFLEDYRDYITQVSAYSNNDKGGLADSKSFKEVLKIEGMLDDSEKRLLRDSLESTEDKKDYRSYIAIIEYLNNIGIKATLFLEQTQKVLYQIAYLATKRHCRISHTPKKELKELQRDFPELLKPIDPEDFQILDTAKTNYKIFLTIKHTLLLIEDRTGVKGFCDFFCANEDDLQMVEEIAMMSLNAFNKDFDFKLTSLINKENGKVLIPGIELDEEAIQNAREQIKDINFFRRAGGIELHHLLYKEILEAANNE